MSVIRLMEIAENAISYLFNQGLLDEFLDDRYLELSKSEREYFGILEDDEDEEEEDWV